MDESGYRIYPDHNDVVVYEEGPNRLLRLDCESAGNCFNVIVPGDTSWTSKMPAWAIERRGIILDRLRDAKCLVREVEGPSTRTESPDRAFLVLSGPEPDDRGFPVHTIRVVSTASYETFAWIENAALQGAVVFDEPTMVIIPFQFRGGRHEIRVDLKDKRFQLDGAQEWHPHGLMWQVLSRSIPSNVGAFASSRTNQYLKPPPCSILPSFFWLFVAMLFVAAGVWQSIAGQGMRTHLIGAFCALFFLLCAWVPAGEIRRHFKSKKTL